MSDGARACVVTGEVSAPLGDAQRRAWITLGVGLGLGVVTQALFWHANLGLNWWLWDALLVASCAFVFARGRISPAAWGAMTACILFGATVPLRASAWSLTIAVPFTLALMALLPFFLLREPPRFMKKLADVPAAISSTVTLPITAVGTSHRGPLMRVFKGLAIGIPTSLLFVALFAADPEFARMLKRAFFMSDRAAGFAFWSIVTATLYVFVFHLHASKAAASSTSESSTTVSAYRDGSLVVDMTPGAKPVVLAGPRVLPTTWATVLLPVTSVFALFVALNVRHIFHGHALVRDPMGPSYSGYLHSGFYQLLAATILSVCLVLAGHAFLRPKDASEIPGGKALRTIEAVLVTLTAVTLISCIERLALYEEAYGATYLRLAVAVIVLMVFGVLVLTLVKVLRRSWRGFGGATGVLVAGIALAAAAFDADGYIAMRNLDRAAEGHPLDDGYLARLSPDARIALSHPYLLAPEQRELRSYLAFAWHAPHRGDWRSWRGHR